MNILTKTFIVLYLVASVALAVFVFMWMGTTQSFKDQLQQERTGRIAAMAGEIKEKNRAADFQAQLASRTQDLDAQIAALKTAGETANRSLTEVKSDLDKANASLAEETNKVKTLSLTVAAQEQAIASKDSELTNTRPQLTDAVKKKSEMERALNEKTNQYDLAVKALRATQEELQVVREKLAQAQQQQKSGAAGSENPAITAAPSAPKMNGKVSEVKPIGDKLFVTLALGSRDGVVVGNRFVIYRDNKYVGDAIIQRVTVDQSVGVVNPLNPGVSVQAGDLVSNGVGM